MLNVRSCYCFETMVNYKMQPSCLQSNAKATKTNEGYANLSSRHEGMIAKVCYKTFSHGIDNAHYLVIAFVIKRMQLILTSIAAGAY